MQPGVHTEGMLDGQDLEFAAQYLDSLAGFLGWNQDVISETAEAVAWH